jgi:hypothetical protein
MCEVAGAVDLGVGNTGALEGLDAVTSETNVAVTFLEVAAS